MTILVTGGCGWVGSWVVYFLARKGRDLVVLDKAVRRYNYWDDIPEGRLKIVQGDVNDRMAVASAFDSGIDGVIHLASPGGPPITEAYAARARTAFDGTLNVLDCCRAREVRNVMFASSGAVYGQKSGSWREDDPPVPCDVYSAFKLAVELVGREIAKAYGIRFTVCRLMHVYGSGMYPKPTDPLKISLFGLLLGWNKLVLERGADQVQDLTYVKDAAAGLILALERGPESRYDIFNISGGKAYTTQEIVATVKRYIPEDVDIQIGAGAENPRYLNGGPLDLARARSEIGYVPRYDLHAGLKDYLSWLQGVRG